MRFSEADGSGGHLITGYGAEGVRIGERWLRDGLVVTPERLIEGWGPRDCADLDPGHLQVLIDLAPEVIVLGTGSAQVFPDAEVHARVLSAGIGLEIMDTGAACRTYNILMGEGRRVAAALIPMRDTP